MNQEIEFNHYNGNTLWWGAVCQDTKNLRPAFDPWEKPEVNIPPVYQDIKFHLIFDIKMGEKFCQNPHFVAGGHMTETPSTSTYAYVVSRDLERIALTISVLNQLEIFSCDIHNAYLTDDCQEKIWTCAGPEFGSKAGTIIIVRKALYGLKSSGAYFFVHLAKTLHGIGFLSTKEKPDVWYRPAVKPNGFEYYE